MKKRDFWWKIVLRLVLCYLLVQIAPALVVIASSNLFEPLVAQDLAALPKGQILFISWGSLVVVGIVVILLTRFLDRRPIAELGMVVPRKAASSALLGLGIGSIAPVIIFAVLWAGGGYMLTGVNPEASFLSIGVFFLIMAPSALSEEIVFRGYTIANLRERLGIVPMLIVSAFIFTLFHISPVLTGMTPIALVSYLLGGLLLAMAFVYHFNLWLPLWVHIGNNFFYSLLLAPNVSIFEGTMLAGQATIDYVDALSVLAAVIVMGILLKRSGFVLRANSLSAYK